MQFPTKKWRFFLFFFFENILLLCPFVNVCCKRLRRFRRIPQDICAATCDFQQCGILTRADSDEPVQPPFKLRNSK